MFLCAVNACLCSPKIFPILCLIDRTFLDWRISSNASFDCSWLLSLYWVATLFTIFYDKSFLPEIFSDFLDFFNLRKYAKCQWNLIMVSLKCIQRVGSAFLGGEFNFLGGDHCSFFFRNTNSWHFCQVCLSWIFVRSCSFPSSDEFLPRRLLYDLVFMILYPLDELFFVLQEVHLWLDCCLCFISLLLFAFSGNVWFTDNRVLLSRSFNRNRCPIVAPSGSDS